MSLWGKGRPLKIAAWACCARGGVPALRSVSRKRVIAITNSLPPICSVARPNLGAHGDKNLRSEPPEDGFPRSATGAGTASVCALLGRVADGRRERLLSSLEADVGADVVDLIMSDHREVERLFDILKNQPEQRLNALPVMATLLVAHSRAEEAEVYPVARDEAGIAEDVEHSQEEHLAAEQILERLMGVDPESKQFDTLLQQVVEEVTHHVEEEESSVLPAMREKLPSKRREELARAFARSRAEHIGDMPGQATKQELMQQAQNVGMGGAQSMDKEKLHDELQKKASS